MGVPTHYTSLAEFILDENDNSSITERTQLVRILSRSSTLPKVEDVYIHTLKSNPDSFLIVPGESIKIGVNFLSNPIAALLCLRYGLEWQIWYKNQPQNTVDSRICDLAALRVAAKFHELTPNIDKDSIAFIPVEIANYIKKFQLDDDVKNILPEIDFDVLANFHGKKPKEELINKEQLTILNLLAAPVEYLMMSGGDVRLNVDSNQLLNKYGCRPFPRPDAFSFASSTASSISNSAYSKTQFKRKRLIKNSFRQEPFKTFRQFSDYLKSQLKKHLSIPETTSIVLASSGTDISLQVAGLCQSGFESELVHILVASDETGSGVPLALQGRHFANNTARGIEVKKGELIDGFREVSLKSILLRDQKGILKKTEEVDQEVFSAIRETLKQGKQPILHVIDQSKLGYISPSEKCMEKIQSEFGDKVLIVIDNSQLRMDPQDIKHYLKQGCLMILTGSKFFTGPPFNGALLIPESKNNLWENSSRGLPIGLTDYFYRNEWPKWPITRKFPKGINPGLHMRWYASLIEIRRYYNTPLSLRYIGIDMFCNHVKSTIDNQSFLEHLHGMNKSTSGAYDPLKMKDRKTIFPFFIKFPNRVLRKEELDLLYKLLNQDLSRYFEEETDDIIRRLAKQACHIGQPVSAIYKDETPSGVVRINLGARVISESWKDRDSSLFFKSIEEQMIQVDIIIRKIKLILDNWEKLKEF